MGRRILSLMVFVVTLATLFSSAAVSFADNGRGHSGDDHGARQDNDDRGRGSDDRRENSAGSLRGVGICHATDSERHPFVFIRVSEEAVTAHQLRGDIVGVNSEQDCPVQAQEGRISLGDAMCPEGQPCVFQATQAGGVIAANVTFATEDGTATGGAACTAGVDYIASVGMITVGPAGSAAIPIQTCADNLTGPNETFRVRLTATSSGRIDDEVGSGVLVEASSFVPAVGGLIEIHDATCIEGSICSIMVSQSGGTAAATVMYSTASMSAVGGAACGPGVDFGQVIGGMVSVPANGTAAIAVTTCADGILEPNEAFLVVLSTTTSGIISRANAQATII